MKQPYRILVLDDDEHALTGIVELLRDAGHVVTGAATYDAAKRLLALGSSDLLVADVHLRGFNGLHLVQQCRRDYPDMATMIITGFDEPFMEAEAVRYGAAFVRKPIQPAEFPGAVAAILRQVRRERRWPRKRVVGGFRVTVNGRPATVLDVGYDGLRLVVTGEGSLPPALHVEISGIGLHLAVEPVWCQRADVEGAIMCGATLASDTTPAARTWRAIVDRLSA